MSFDKLFDGSDAHLLPSSPAECAAYLRRYNAWRRGDDTIEQPEPKELGFAIAMAAELIDRHDELLAALTGLVEEKQPLGIDRPAYQNAIALIVMIEDGAE